MSSGQLLIPIEYLEVPLPAACFLVRPPFWNKSAPLSKVSKLYGNCQSVGCSIYQFAQLDGEHCDEWKHLKETNAVYIACCANMQIAAAEEINVPNKLALLANDSHNSGRHGKMRGEKTFWCKTISNFCVVDFLYFFTCSSQNILIWRIGRFFLVCTIFDSKYIFCVKKNICTCF